MPLQRVAICVCTRERPKMLAACLASLAGLIVPGDISPSIVVVDNEREPNSFFTVAEFAEANPAFPVRYVHQPKPGIAAARNAAIDEAFSIGADWIAFIDDDERAHPDWIAALMAPVFRHVPILGGANITQFPDAIPEWLRPRSKPRLHGSDSVTGAGNIRVAASVFERLRFNEDIGMGGGEDGEFILRARAAGLETRHTALAITFEAAHPERYTARGVIARSYWTAAANMREEIIRDGRWKAISRRLPAIAGAALVSAGQLAIGAVRFALKRHGGGRRKMLGAGKGLAVAAGRIAAIAGHIPQAYRNVHGS